jgi:protein SHQ1
LKFLASECDWQLPQELPELLSASLQAQYGFLNMHSGYLKHATHTENEINELGDDAETCSRAERTLRRLKHEDEKWDEEHYM